MIFSFSKDGERIEASPGLEGYCEGCNSLLIPRCGDINVWHWAHEASSCDSWHYEPKTFWHRQWQERFHVEDTELGIKKGGQYHIADIVGNNDVVLEIQHSPISEKEILKRELFYDKMIWILNGKSFGHNLSMVEYRDDFYEKALSHYIEPEKDGGGYLDRIKLIVPSNDDNSIYNALRANPGICRESQSIENLWYLENLDFYYRNGLPTDIKAAYFAYALHHELFICMENDDESYPVDLKWKHLRKSWLKSTKPIFIDIGPQLLLWITAHTHGNEFEAKVISKDRFFKKYRKRMPVSIKQT